MQRNPIADFESIVELNYFPRPHLLHLYPDFSMSGFGETKRPQTHFKSQALDKLILRSSCVICFGPLSTELVNRTQTQC